MYIYMYGLYAIYSGSDDFPILAVVITVAVICVVLLLIMIILIAFIIRIKYNSSKCDPTSFLQ